jgi:hypothetical protein
MHIVGIDLPKNFQWQADRKLACSNNQQASVGRLQRRVPEFGHKMHRHASEATLETRALARRKLLDRVLERSRIAHADRSGRHIKMHGHLAPPADKGALLRRGARPHVSSIEPLTNIAYPPRNKPILRRLKASDKPPRPHKIVSATRTIAAAAPSAGTQMYCRGGPVA